ncbi:FAD-dependent monooxygenase [Streptacidiphilus jiangxiensis]|uniref:2-polyprenyl-6-methoxyphenol hydroxylase n=1 Tax=Streptacidiphilus jiangxiensis TaxID=235985 RepID=A0A1H7HY58_STRJI|nr:FAD-dependent monooxygenase [Streptacidiphilus jiangxiensis]SEK55088.1 2-polyprenyl-6-methoxyphenol hydroxylase [Streptacidiphilus jiangxiensis]
MRGLRVAVVGGSIAGCAAARALHRAGAGEVVVLERATGRLQDRGVGLGIQKERYAELEAAGYLDAEMPWIDLARRPWVVRDGTRRAGRVIATLPFPYRSYSWGSLWQELRRRVPDAVDHRTSTAVTAVADGPDGAVLTLGNGREERFDLVVGADGHRSLVRAAMLPPGRSTASFSGYLAWRGTLATEQLPDPAEAFPEDSATTVAFPGGHMISYRIPGTPDGDGGARVNWVFYATPPTHLADALADPESTPSTSVAKELTDYQLDVVARHLPGYWQDVVHNTPEERRLLQPIHDVAAPSYARGRLVLLGDAAAIARPHTGSGALKALQDATVLGRAMAEAPSVPAGLAVYDAERAPVGRTILELGRAVGRAHVQRTPDWAAMDQPAFEAWWQANGGPGIGGRPLGRG